jgi:hypothetical protein
LLLLLFAGGAGEEAIFCQVFEYGHTLFEEVFDGNFYNALCARRTGFSGCFSTDILLSVSSTQN